MTETLGTYRIPDSNIDALEARVEKLSKRAKKLGVEPIKVTRVGHEDVPHKCLTTWGDIIPTCRVSGQYVEHCPLKGTVARTWTVEVDGETPKYAGWSFVATVEHTSDGNIVRTVPGSGELPQEFRSTKNTRCDQCHTNRFRRDTYVVVKADDYRQVGSDCIKDFLGHKDPHALASWAEALAAFGDDLSGAEDENWSGGGGGERLINGEEYLVHVAAMVRTSGWLSRTKARENAQYDDGKPTYATADRALDNLFPSKEMIKNGEVVAIEDVDKERAVAALAWAENVLHEMDDRDLNDYLHNLRAVTSSVAIRPKHTGLYASLLTTAEREGEKAERIAREKTERAKTVHVGTVGKREVFKNLTVKSTREIEGAYGLVTVITFRDPDGNALVWFKSGGNMHEVVDEVHEKDDGTTWNSYKWVTEFEVDHTYDVKATVKKHNGDDKYGPQTVLSRCALVKEVAA